ncbi:MAG: ROK family transcriptional regulator [Chloroflexi bacterium]|nr:ROK family transcriptional regulator [Chloroflexota bacterium]
MVAATQKATHEQTKNHNKRLILKTIYDQPETSRADIARMTGLTRPTVSSNVAELIEEGLVEEVGQGQSEGGKPPILLSVVDNSRHLIAIDLADSEFQGAVVDLRGRIIHRECLPVNDRDGEAALEIVYELGDKLIAAAPPPLLGIGIGTPGLIDAQSGIVRKAVNLDWQDLPLRHLLKARYQLPVHIANDGHVAALGEYIFGQGRKTANLIIVKVGRGVIAGIVLNGRLHYGDSSGAGEIGHVKVVEGGLPCRCGHSGCLETVINSRAIVEQARIIAQTNPDSTLNHLAIGPDALTPEYVFQAFEAGDQTLQPIIAEVGRYLGLAVAHLVGVLNVQCVLICGAVARFGEPLLDPIRQEMRRRSLALLADQTYIGLSRLGQDIVLQGAAALLLANELELV